MNKTKIYLPLFLGAKPDIIDRRDKRYEDVMGGRPAGMPSLEKGYNVEEIKGRLKDDYQHKSFRCVGQGGTCDIEMTVLVNLEKYISLSIRDAYSQIYLSGGGAYPRDLYKLAHNKGICEERFCPSYPADGSDVTEAFSRKRGIITPERIANALKWKIGAYRSISSLDLEVMAQSIFVNNGCGGGYIPVNAGMGHFIFFNGYGMHKGYYGLQYRDSYPPFQKWIIKHRGKFYYASTNQPLAFEIKLFSIWTAEAGDWLKKKMTNVSLKELEKLYELSLFRDLDAGAKSHLNFPILTVMNSIAEDKEWPIYDKAIKFLRSTGLIKFFDQESILGKVFGRTKK